MSKVIQEKEENTYTFLPLEKVALRDLKPHPRNYRSHPDDEINHLKESIVSNGIYRNIVISQDNVILAGHGVYEAARQLGLDSLPVYRFPHDADDPTSIKLLVSDNEISHLAMNDDRALTELLRELKEIDASGSLLGTGYDEMMLANLLYITRPASEIHDLDAAAQWVGLPEYDLGENRLQIIVNFLHEEDRQEFCQLLGLDTHLIKIGAGKGKSIWWPPRPKDDVTVLRFTDREEGGPR